MSRYISKYMYQKISKRIIMVKVHPDLRNGTNVQMNILPPYLNKCRLRFPRYIISIIEKIFESSFLTKSLV
jgi:hypothetical protein